MDALIEGLLVAAARLYLYEFSGVRASQGSKHWTWERYDLAMHVAYDERRTIRGSSAGERPAPVGKVILN